MCVVSGITFSIIKNNKASVFNNVSSHYYYYDNANIIEGSM